MTGYDDALSLGRAILVLVVFGGQTVVLGWAELGLCTSSWHCGYEGR